MRLLVILVFFLLVTHNVNAKIYKWVDENGTVHFSDKPYSEDAEEVNVKRTGIRITGNDASAKSPPEQKKSAADQKSQNISSPEGPSGKKENVISEKDYRITSNVGKIGADAIRIAGRINSGPSYRQKRYGSFRID